MPILTTLVRVATSPNAKRYVQEAEYDAKFGPGYVEHGFVPNLYRTMQDNLLVMTGDDMMFVEMAHGLDCEFCYKAAILVRTSHFPHISPWGRSDGDMTCYL